MSVLHEKMNKLLAFARAHTKEHSHFIEHLECKLCALTIEIDLVMNPGQDQPREFESVTTRYVRARKEGDAV